MLIAAVYQPLVSVAVSLSNRDLSMARIRKLKAMVNDVMGREPQTLNTLRGRFIWCFKRKSLPVCLFSRMSGQRLWTVLDRHCQPACS